MKKILFNDKYGLTQAVLDGRKTMTRRVIKCPQTQHGIDVSGFEVHTFSNQCREVVTLDYDDREIGALEPTYKVGEIVAIAQSYKDAGWDADTLQEAYVKTPTIFPDLDEYHEMSGIIDLPFKYHKGWTNKMFVKADLMPHAIEITGIKVERLQDCSDEDCLREGIKRCNLNKKFAFDDKRAYNTSCDAFAALIDKVSGKGTWESNPWCFCYEFKLIK